MVFSDFTRWVKKYVFRAWRHHSITFHTFVLVVVPYHYIMTGIAYWFVSDVVHHGAMFTFTGSTFSVCKHVIRYWFLI